MINNCDFNVLQSSTRQQSNISQSALHQPVTGFSQPSVLYGGGATGQSGGMSNYPSKNKFLPPPIGKKERKLIENMEYVDFEDILPGIAPTVFTKNDHTIDIDQNSSTLKLAPKKKQGKILYLSHWLIAWNRFMEATLYYHPHLFYDLFKYQQHMCEFAGKFKFEACYMYDIDCRLAMSAQLSVDPADRSVSWAEISKEYENRHLTKNVMLPVCDHCYCTGHSESYCPVRKKENKNRPKLMDYAQGDSDQFRNADQLRNFVMERSTSGNSKGSKEFDGRLSEANRQPFRPSKSGQENKRGVCYRYNRGQQCYEPCRFDHVCNKCPEPREHPGYTCTSNVATTTRFVPRRDSK